MPAPDSSVPGAQADAQKPARPNTSGNYSVLSYCSIFIWLFEAHLAESYYPD
jgi:hypothetical protein